MEKRLDIRQSETRILQDQLDSAVVTSMDSVLASINNELTPPGRLIAQFAPTLTVTVGSGTIVNPNTLKNRVLPFVNNTPIVFPGGTIVFPSTTGTITVSPGVNASITIGANQFVAVLVQLDSTGLINLAVGLPAGSLVTAVIPTGNTTFLSLGYIIVHSNGSSVIQNIINSMLYQFSGGGGGTAGYIQDPIVNNQVVPANLAGFLINSALVNGFTAEYSIDRITSPSVASVSEYVPFDTNLGYGSTGGFTYPGFGLGIVKSIAVQSNGQILVGGYFDKLNNITRNFLVRLNTDGTIDSTFATNIGTGFNAQVNAIAIQGNGQILIGGDFTTFKGVTRYHLVRLNSDGTEDTSFATAASNTNTNAPIEAIAVQANGQILVGGQFTIFNGLVRSYLVRLNSDGTEDIPFYTTYTSGGTFNNFVNSIAVQPNTDVLVGGAFNNGFFPRTLVRFTSSGIEDITFSTNIGGHFATSGGNAPVNSIVLQSNGQILVGGVFSSWNTNATRALVRLNINGTEDTTFSTNIGNGFNNPVLGVAVQANGQILVGGSFFGPSGFNGLSRNYIVRLNSTGIEDSAFYTQLGTGFNDPVYEIAVAASDSPIYVGGNFTGFNGNVINAMVALINSESMPGVELITEGTIRGIYRPSTTSWTLGGQNSMGDDPGVSFSMTNAGQMQYTSTNIVGTTVLSEIRFIITRL